MLFANAIKIISFNTSTCFITIMVIILTLDLKENLLKTEVVLED